jgi:hypothetical protein
MRNHFKKIINTERPRNYLNVEILDSVANYLKSEFIKYADTVYYQPFEVKEKIYKNVIAVFGKTIKETIVVGAHYDVCEDQDGADDNASGTVGLLEVARQLKGIKLNKRIELVAYTLEEPPFFRSESMGSYIHAKSLKDSDRNIFGMICLEMIAYFNDTSGSQDYPIDALRLKYGSKGDFITLVNRLKQGNFAREFTSKYIKFSKIKTKKFTAQKSLPGIDFSDHLNYWKFGYSALMITDSGFYRNKNYHKKSDLLRTLDLKRMALVINGVVDTLIDLNREER